MTRSALLWTLLLLAPAVATAACDAPGYRQFDFWIGQWAVSGAGGKLAGHNRIEAAYEGCVLRETYTTAGGYRGESLNVYDAGRDRWHQTWVDNSGRLLLLEGGLSGADMVLEGTSTERDGSVGRHRIRWTPNADGSVRQHWQVRDQAGGWKTLFDGVYVRKER